MLKIFGVLCVIGGCSGIGWYAVSGYAARIHVLEELEQALQFLYGEISYSKSDMAELMGRLSTRGDLLRDFWHGLQERLQQHMGQPFFFYWQAQMPEIHGFGHLTAEDRLLIEKIGSNLGNLDRQTQLEMIRLFQKKLEDMIGQASAEYRGKAKVSMVSAVTAGLFLALLLL